MSSKPDPRNPRAHSRTQIKQIARSIESFGFNVPVLVDADMQVVAGHGRLAACKHLGWSEVPTIRLEHLDEAQRRAFMIADNRLNETSSWDERLPAEQLKDLSILNLDFAIEATGFDMGEIDLRIASLVVDWTKLRASNTGMIEYYERLAAETSGQVAGPLVSLLLPHPPTVFLSDGSCPTIRNGVIEVPEKEMGALLAIGFVRVRRD